MEAAPHPWPAIGALLLRDGLVEKEVLESLLEEQRDTRQQRISGWRLGEILVERGLVTEEQVSRLVAEQYELPFVELDVEAVDPVVAARLPEALVDRFSAIALEMRDDGSLLLAVSDPATVLFSDELRRAVGMPLRFAVVSPAALKAALVALRATPSEQAPPTTTWSSDAPAHDVVVDRGDDSSANPGRSAATHTLVADTGAWPALGTLLVRDGLISEDELETALAQQRLSSNKRLGEILVERGSVTRSDVARIVAEQYELPFVDLAPEELDPRVAALLPHEIARRYGALPLRFEPDGSVLVAVADPTRVLEPEEILEALGARLSFAVADPDAIESAILQVRIEADPEAVPSPEPAAALEAVEAAEHAVDTLGAEPLERPEAEHVVEVAEYAADTPEDAAVAAAPAEIGTPAVEDAPAAEPIEALVAEDVVDAAEAEDGTTHPEADAAASPESMPTDGVIETGDAVEAAHEEPPAIDEARAAEAVELPGAPEDVPRAFVMEELHDEPHPMGGESAASAAAEAPALEIVRSDDEAPDATVARSSSPDDVVEPAADTMTPLAGFDLLELAAGDDVFLFPDPPHLPAEQTEGDARALKIVPSGEYEARAEVAIEVELDADAESETVDVDAVEEDGAETDYAPGLVGVTEEPRADAEEQDEEEDTEQRDAEPTATAVDVHSIVERAAALGASTVRFSAHEHGLVARARIDGVLQMLELDTNATALSPEDLAALERRGDVEVVVLSTPHGPSATVRFRVESPPPTTLAELGLAEDAEKALRSALARTAGLVVVAGPHDSGRTTTLYALLEELSTPERAIATVEQAVQRPVPGVDHVVVASGAERAVARTLEDVVRSDPDVVAVDEIDDVETAELAARAAWSRLVVAVVDAPSAAEAIERLADLGVARDTLGATTAAILTQRLVRRICTDCRESYFPRSDELAELDRPEDESGRRLLGRGRGCSTCAGSGYQGRIGVFAVTGPLSEIDDPETDVATLRDEAIRLCLDGVTTSSEARDLAREQTR